MLQAIKSSTKSTSSAWASPRTSSTAKHRASSVEPARTPSAAAHAGVPGPQEQEPTVRLQSRLIGTARCAFIFPTLRSGSESPCLCDNTTPKGWSRRRIAVVSDRVEQGLGGLAISEILSLGAVLAAGAFGFSWVFLGGFYGEFGLTPAEVGVGYEDAIATTVVFASSLGIIALMVAGCLVVATGVRDGLGWPRLVAVLLITVAAAGSMVAANAAIGPPTRWILWSLLTLAIGAISLGTWGRRRLRYAVLIVGCVYLVWLPYVHQLGRSLGELVPAELSDPRTALVPRWPSVVCATSSSPDSSLPVGPDWDEPWLYFGNNDGIVILARPELEVHRFAPVESKTVVIRVPSESVYLLATDNANKWGNYVELACSSEGLHEEFGH